MFLLATAIAIVSAVSSFAMMDGAFASQPVIANDMIYVITSDFGGMMQGNTVFSRMFPNYNPGSTAHSYQYVFDMNGTLVSKTVLH